MCMVSWSTKEDGIVESLKLLKDTEGFLKTEILINNLCAFTYNT